MVAEIRNAKTETDKHAQLKWLAFVWAQAQGFSACAMEVSLPCCRYRADVAACRRQRKQIGWTAIFECKQARADLRRDNCRSEAMRRRLELICDRRQMLEASLRLHYPNLQSGDSLFPEFDAENFAAIGHRGYARLSREVHALQTRLYDCTKFDRLVRYRCANLFFVVVPEEVFRDSEVPIGWGALVESNETLTVIRKPTWHETTPQNRLDLLHHIATAATRSTNRALGITFEHIQCPRSTEWHRP